MKVLKIIALVLFSFVLVLSAGAFVFIKTFDVNALLPQITREASKVMGRELGIARAAWGFSFTQGLFVEAGNITLADDPRFSARHFLTVKRAQVVVDVGAFVFRHKIKAGRVLIEAPELVIIRSREELINALSIVPAASLAAVAPEPASVQAAAALPAFTVSDISITRGRLTYIDETFPDKLMLTVDQIDINGQDFSMTGPFTLTARASLVSPAQDMNARLTLSFDPLSEIFSSLNGQITVDAKDGVLEHVNLLTLALGHIPMLPGLLDTILPDLSSETRHEIEQGITRLALCQVWARIVSGVVQIETADLVTRDLGLQAKGWIKLVEDLDLKADVRIPADLSERLGARVKELSYLKDDQGRIYVPLSLSGSAIKPKVMPDREYLTKKLIMAVGGGKLGDLLGGNKEAGQAVDAIFELFRKK